MAYRTLDDLDLYGKRVLVRVDFNVPLSDSTVGDDTRIQAALPTIRELINANARVILCSHLGRPKGQVKPEFSLRPVADHLAGLLGQDVAFASDVVDEDAQRVVGNLEPGQVALLENLRFEPGEEKNDAGFAANLAALADCYVNDAFGAAHRAHASTDAVARLLPSAAGRLMQREIEALTRVLHDPAQPVVLILGGAKVSDKIGVIESFLGFADSILIGGAMANTFLLAQGHDLGQSLTEPDLADTARDLLRQASERGVEITLPVDCVVAPSLDEPQSKRVVQPSDIPSDHGVFDIGPQTVRSFARCIAKAGTVVWNGPLGVFEVDAFADGTLGVGRAVADSEAYSVVGGGDSVAALNEMDIEDQIDHVSTGGGASLEFLEGKQLPGIAALEEDLK